MEVLASMFIICIGLLSVLMVIPYGAFQVSKARNAEYISNMLAAGAEDLQITGIVTDIISSNKFDNFDIEDISSSQSPFVVPVFVIDPIVRHGNLGVFVPVQLGVPEYDNLMFGKDDVEYVLRDDARTRLQNADGSQQYSYFVTIKPREVIYNSETDKVSVKFNTDLLGCYRRAKKDEGYSGYAGDAVFGVSPDASKTQFYSKAAKLRIHTTSEVRLDFSTTRYVFITWTRVWPPEPEPGKKMTMNCGEWCKVVSVSEVEGEQAQDIVVLANEFVSEKNINVSENLSVEAARVFIFPGVMYHKRIYD
jgi:hypothetical protein